MNAKKVNFILIGVIILLGLAGAGSVVLGNVSLQKKSQQLVGLKLNNRILNEQQLALQTAKKNIEKYADLEQIAKSVVPQDKDQAEVVREIIDIAGQSGIKIRTIAFPSSNLGAGATTSTPSASSSSTPTSAAAAPISQAVPVPGISGVYSLAVTITPDDNPAQPITYYQFLDFLKRLENNRRTAQVTDVKVIPTGIDNKNPIVSFSLTMNIFIKP